MVRPERRVVLAGASPARVSAGAPGSRLQPEGEIRPSQAECQEPLKQRGAPLLGNLYLNEVDQMLERAKAVTRRERWTAVEYARFDDDLVILDSQPRQQWLRQAVEKRLRQELASQTASGGE